MKPSRISNTDGSETARPFFVIAGAALDTPNRGVSALSVSAFEALIKRLPAAEFGVLDYGAGSSPIATGDHELTRIGAFTTRRVWRPESWARIQLEGRVPSGGSPTTRLLRRAAAFLDVSGGDSFTTLYGPQRYRSITEPKRFAIRQGCPLVLLPQTYGPFDDETRPDASALVRKAHACWARDARSFDILKGLLAVDFDPERHRLGVDLAFGLDPRPAHQKLPQELRDVLEGERQGSPLIGFNVSGLIFNDPEKAVSRYRFKADYQESVIGTLTGLLDGSDAKVVLVPHVVSEPGHYESDPAASDAVYQRLSEQFPGRVLVAPASLDQSEVKWLIAQTDWFCGTRMHSTIAALSSGVPTATIAYSDKAKGVFETCGQGDEVIDPRELETADVVERLLHSCSRREHLRLSLAEHLPGVLAQAQEQMDAIARQVTEATGSRSATSP